MEPGGISKWLAVLQAKYKLNPELSLASNKKQLKKQTSQSKSR